MILASSLRYRHRHAFGSDDECKSAGQHDFVMVKPFVVMVKPLPAPVVYVKAQPLAG
jgi:hypothetical protein